MTTIIIDGCDSGVENQVLDGGYTMVSKLTECADNAENHWKFVSCVSKIAKGWKKAKFITCKEKLAIICCAAKYK